MTMDADYWKTYLRRDGKILVKLDKIMYWFKEAAYWWNKTLTKVFLDNGYRQMSKDQCVMVKTEGFEVIVTSQIDSFRASMRTVVLIRVILELILRV